jgi:hypothetical protein
VAHAGGPPANIYLLPLKLDKPSSWLDDRVLCHRQCPRSSALRPARLLAPGTSPCPWRSPDRRIGNARACSGCTTRSTVPLLPPLLRLRAPDGPDALYDALV